MPRARLRYADNPSQSVDCELLYSWDRGNLQHETSAPTFRNMALSLFRSSPEITRVVLVRANGLLLFLLRGPQNCWFDVEGKQVALANSATG
jgi:hypothetical protein